MYMSFSLIIMVQRIARYLILHIFILRDGDKNGLGDVKEEEVYFVYCAVFSDDMNILWQARFITRCRQ